MGRWGVAEHRAPARVSAPVATASGVVVGVAGLAFVGLGLWGRREVRRGLARERITSTGDATPPNAPVTSGSAARSLAEVIRRRTLETAGGRAYSETETYVDAEGNATSDAEAALKDERTGEPVENPQHALWIQSTTLQTALNQAYVSEKLSELTIALGAALVAAGAGIAAAARR